MFAERRHCAAHRAVGDAAWLHELQQTIRSVGLDAGTAHAKTAEGLTRDATEPCTGRIVGDSERGVEIGKDCRCDKNADEVRRDVATRRQRGLLPAIEVEQ